MNFDFEYIMPRAGEYGKRLEHDRWDGLVGDLIVGVGACSKLCPMTVF